MLIWQCNPCRLLDHLLLRMEIMLKCSVLFLLTTIGAMETTLQFLALRIKLVFLQELLEYFCYIFNELSSILLYQGYYELMNCEIIN